MVDLTPCPTCARLERELKVEQTKNNNSLARNLCSDHIDKQLNKPCLACTIERLERELQEAINSRTEVVLGVGLAARMAVDDVETLRKSNTRLRAALANLVNALDPEQLDSMHPTEIRALRRQRIHEAQQALNGPPTEETP